jgi:dienelactone hydrolase
MTNANTLLDPIHQLDALSRTTPREYAFTARDARTARQWQRRARKAVRETIGFHDLARVPLRPKKLESIDRGNFIREKFVLRTSSSSEMPVYVLTPKDNERFSRPLPCVLALHGHGYGVKDIVGIRTDGTDRDNPEESYHKDFAVELARRGFLVIAPEINCFGERSLKYEHLDERRRPTTCFNVGTYAMMLGGTVLGLRVWDGMRAVDYLKTRKDADVSRLGVMGISGGGMHAFFSAAMDTRVKAAVVSGYFCDWRHSILAIHHCLCNFVPGLLKLAELSDLAGLIAPRPLLVENGTEDDIFPIEPVKQTVTKARRAWKVFGAEKDLETDYFQGKHEISGAKAYDFLAKHLNADA